LFGEILFIIIVKYEYLQYPMYINYPPRYW